MKKLIFVFISVLLLASCAQGQSAGANTSSSTDVSAATDVVQPPPALTDSVLLTSPSPAVSLTPSLPTTGSVMPMIHFDDSDNVSKTLTISNIKKYFKTKPEDLFTMLGDDADILGYVDDIDAYVVGSDRLNFAIHYSCDFEETEDSFTELPKLPVKRILVHDFKFGGLSEKSAFKDVINTLGDTELLSGYIEGSKYYYLRYVINGLWFEFTGSNKTASSGVNLSIVP